ncbi:carboxypeptidase-like regulatory domain-containing protein [Marinilongibacter aquaticus]|uniref:TonB-dependent receptor n=1 Tax=Marinilongibacter aquaticus TaxID=2975157 RepID=UPI0021BDE1D5|nr:TonB-dependent receptor [Marinilongibacter aquaticus]UBM58736.1 carboxypeptidase-like regulatory domain-containing protein [Marinilongibacter aquaticus]
MLKSLSFCLFVFMPALVVGMGEGPTMKGSVRDKSGEPIVGAIVSLSNTARATFTDTSGFFALDLEGRDSCTIRIQHIGYKPITLHFTAAEMDGNDFQFVLEEDTAQLDEIIVRGRSRTQEVRLQPIKAEVINTRQARQQPTTLVELMNRSAGIRVRQMGGLGSYAGLMVNGFQGKAIKNFKDGIPMDYLGAAYDLSLVPVNMLERVEVYKGVLPASLGADALGGAVNMVTKKAFGHYAEASYEVASFNTHRASFNGLNSDSSRHYFVGIDAFYNHSDNNYNVDVNVLDQETATLYPAKVKLFHNRFSNIYAELYAGIMNTEWTDELRLGLTYFSIDRENQFGSSMSKPFGAATSEQYAAIPTLRYRKAFKRISFDQFLTASGIHVRQTDTARGTYDWFGNFIPSPSRKGELSVTGSLARIKYSYLTSRSNFRYRLADRHDFLINVVSTNAGRSGRDPRALPTKSGRDLLSVPAHYDKLIVSAGIHSKELMNGKISGDLIGKYYHYSVNTVDADWDGDEIVRQKSDGGLGAALALKYQLNAGGFFRFSAESARRLPEQYEMFGDGNFHLSNFELRPERSTNFNLGFRSEKFRKYSVELNGFYRITHDLILLMPVNIFFTQNQNVDNVKGMGLETDLNLFPMSWLGLSGNFTYQDFRLFDTGNVGLEGAKLRNTPYFFANLGANTHFGNLISERDRLQLFYHFQFVREYYLDYIPEKNEPSGFLGLWGRANLNAPNIIPNQVNHSFGAVYTPNFDRISISVQVKNIFNRALYDNFRVQNAGRSLHVKANYRITK